MVNILGSIGGILGRGKPAEAKKTSNNLKEEDSVKFAIGIADEVSSAIDNLLELHSPEYQTSNSKEKLKEYISRTSYLLSIKDKLDEAGKANPSIEDFTIIKFCRSIAENKELNDFAEKCSDIGYDTHFEELYPQLNKIVANLNKHQLKEKISFLKKLKEKSDFNAIRNDYKDKWDFDDLVGDKKFKEEYIDKAVDEKGKSFSKSLKEDLTKYTELAEQGKKAASKYFGKEVELQAYYTKDNILNINLTNHDKSKPTRISDVLQQEENTSELNIYCNKKHEIHARQDKDKKRRHYEFKEGACYEMTSTWPAKDKSGSSSVCTMVMNVSNDGITKILKFDDGKESELQLEEVLELIKQNHELYIQGRSLYDAVEKSLGLQSRESLRVIEKDKEKTMPDIVPVANNSSQKDKIIEVNHNPNDKGTDTSESNTAAAVCNTSTADNSSQKDKAIEVNHNPNDKGTDTNQDSESNTAATVCNTSTSEIIKPNQATPTSQQAIVNTEINPLQAAAHTEVDLRKTEAETQTEINAQQIATQTEVDSQQIATQTEVNSQQIATQTEVNSQQIATQTEVNSQQIATQTEVDSQQMDELILNNQRLSKELSRLTQEASKLKEKNVELNQAVEAGLQVMNQEYNKLIREKQLLREELKTTQAEKEELNQKLLKISELDERIKHVNELLKDKVEELCGEKCDLQGELKKTQIEKVRLDQKLVETRQEIGRLEQQNNDLQADNGVVNQAIESLEEQNRILKAENYKIREELIQRKKAQKKNARELERMYEKEEKAERELGALNKENSGLKSEVDELKTELNQTQEYAEQIMVKKCQSEENLKVEMSKLEQDYKEQLKSSAKKSGEQLWTIKELQNELDIKNKELQRKKKIFEEAERVYGELKAELESEKMKNSMREGILQGMVEIRKGLENEIKELKEIIAELEKTVVNQDRKNENLTKQNKVSRNKIQTLHKQLKIFTAANTTDVDKINHLVETNPEIYKLVQALDDMSDVILPKQQFSKSSSVESGFDSGKENCSNNLPRSAPVSNPQDSQLWVERVRLPDLVKVKL